MAVKCLVIQLLLLLLVSASRGSGSSSHDARPVRVLSIRQEAQSEGLHSLMVAAGKLFFGTATDTNLFNDTAYQSIATNANEFGLHVPENSQKWQPTEPVEGQFDFVNPDTVASRARAQGQMFRCHTLTWHSQLPNFVQTTQWTRETLTLAIQTHITNTVTHFKGQCYSWDVVNEALNDNGTMRNDVFFRTLGTDYLAISFLAARAADPGAKLYYNDFNLETLQAKADGAVRIIQLLQQQQQSTSGAVVTPVVDGVGFQAHFNVGQTPNKTSLMATMSRFVAMGLEVSFSELDIAHTRLPATEAALRQQAEDYVTVVDACLSTPRCVGITVWEFTDKYSWIPSTFPGEGDACLFSANMTRKPAYSSVSSFLASAAATAKPGGGSSSTRVGGAAAAASASGTGVRGNTAPFTTGSPADSALRSSSSAPAGIIKGAGLWMVVLVGVSWAWR
ncbi:glycoside hydrolase superfamily [Diplogelasinospora grovesii]|uniref:Beta-xylanase n=1 Tax=Diplogelasinospora grovesii TaxID=303347 RepID=A0AAN6N000_9PEZI|nr:glycoside hydrolase superfamily [Diplogelasinospora grovesii]